MKIINVIDTREYIQGPDDKWFPVPGSGDINICDRCGKGHEVHYHIEIEGNGKVVGGGCAKKDGFITETQHKSIGSAILTLSKNQAELKFLLESEKIQNEIWAKVERMEIPEIIKGEFVKNDFCFTGRIDKTAIFKMGDAEQKIHCFEYIEKNGDKYDNYRETEEKRSLEHSLEQGKIQLLNSWKRNRFVELAPKGFRQVSKYEIEKVEHQVKRAEKKIQKLMVEV